MRGERGEVSRRGRAMGVGAAHWLAPLLAGMLALSLAPTPGLTSSQDLFGVGARGIAMGGAVVSNSRGFPAVYYNPAGLVGRPGEDSGNRFTLGYQRADYRLLLNDARYPVDPASNLLVGVNIPIPFGGVLADRFALGLGFVLPTASVLRAEVPAPEVPFFTLLEHRAQVVGVHAGLGLRITDWLQVGFGVVALAELVGSLDVAPNETGSLGTVVRDELVGDYAPIAGLLVEPWEWLSFGLAFHGASESRFTFPITADLGDDFPIEVPLLQVEGVAQYDPLQVAAEVTVRPLPHLTLAAGVRFKRWSAFENPIANTTEPVPEQDPPDFSDTWVPRLGAEYTLVGSDITWDLRVGGFYEPSPIPEQRANANFLDAARLGVGAGVGWSWQGLTVDLALQFQAVAERSHTKDGEAVRDPENAGLPSISHSGHILVSVLELGLVF